MRRALPLIGLVLLFTSSSLLLARQGSVRTRDGRTIEGDINEEGTEVRIKMRGGSVTLKADEVASISYAASVREQYEEKLKALPQDAGSREHYELARWLYDQREYDLARTEINRAIQLDPNDADAVTLRQTIDRQAQLQRAQPNATGRPADPNRPIGQRPLGKDRNLLDADQINLIRQHEMRDDETNVRVRLENNVRNRFVEQENLEPRNFNRLPETQKAILILKSDRTPPDMRQDVRIMSDPMSLLTFKQRIQPMLLQGCATSNCHAVGSPNAGRFVLHAPADNEAVTYTNFYYLTQFRTGVDTTRPKSPFQQSTLKAIDRVQPRDSLVLHFALPRDIAEFDHPEVPNWNNIYRNTQDLRYQQMLSWIGDVLLPVEADYRKILGHPLPWGDDEPSPSGQPAAQPNNNALPRGNVPPR
jgi:tetratricopeptide (TPR) repeat protein